MSTLTSTSTSFVGRRALLTEVRQLLGGNRVVTLTGPGGIGKSRVAARIMDDERSTYPDGGWWVDLSAVPDPALVPPALADALGQHAEAATPLVDILVDFVADRRALLVLDGCERVLDAVVDLVEHLRAGCPALRVLVTSREPLRISGEAVVRVPPLTTPEHSRTATPESLAQYESVTLFVGRASLVSPGFELTTDNAADVVELCAALDGVPLALELAAARIPSLSPAAMVEQLSDRFRLLDRGYRDAPDRHRSLEACVDWSHDLCNLGEQALWCRMAVFAGGCDIAAAEAVCADDELEADDIQGLLTSLVDKSVVTATHGDDGSVRYTLQDHLAAYGRERLEDDGLLERWRERHATWCVVLAAGFRTAWVGDQQVMLLRRVRREHANVRAALEFCASDSAMSDRVLTIATDLDSFWVTAGLAHEARHWLEMGLATQRGKPADRALAMVLLARYAGLQHDLADARQWLEQASVTADTADDDRTRGLNLVLTAVLAAWDGDLLTAVDASERARPFLTAAGDVAGELLAYSVSGLCLGLAGEQDAAVLAHERSIARAEAIGETFRRSFSLSGLGELALVAGDLEGAEGRFREALRMKAELGDRMGVAVALDGLARTGLARAEPQRAAILLGAAHAIWDAIGMRDTGNPFARAPSASAGLHLARGMLGKQEFRSAFRRGAGLSMEQAIRYALDDVSDVAPASPSEPSPLTRRETEVAELVADGLSNPEIAERLVISVRTAQGHVENILRKLGFTSRAMIAAWVTQRRAEVSRA